MDVAIAYISASRLCKQFEADNIRDESFDSLQAPHTQIYSLLVIHFIINKNAVLK